MKTVTKNLDTIISSKLHRPIEKKSGQPLYARIDGQQELGNDNLREKSDEWDKACQGTYNSPTNIRRVFITERSVIIQYYKPFIVNGEPRKGGCWTSGAFDADENNLHKLALGSIRFEELWNGYMLEKQVNPNAVEPVRYILKGTGIGALSKPWVASNIEEVYFDWTVLCSEELRNAGIGCEELLRAHLNRKSGYVKCNVPMDIFKYANTRDINDIRSRYPRLKVIGMINHLAQVLQYESQNKKGAESLKDTALLWIERPDIVNVIKGSGSLIAVNKITSDLPKYNQKFALRDGIYRFDRDVLKPFTINYGKRISDTLNKTNKVEVQRGEAVRVEKSELEKLLDKIAETRGMNDAKSTLLLSLTGATTSEVESVFKEMSSEGEERYRELINNK